ncbi:MAG: protein kinase [Myxococcota bacterium]
MRSSSRDSQGMGLAPENSTSGTSVAFSDRVRLYLKVTTLINVAFAIIALTVRIFGLDPDPEGAPLRLALIWGVTAINGLAWFVIARSRSSVRAALFTEAIATLALGYAYSSIILILGAQVERAESIVAILLVTIILVLRSSLVPSPVLATVVIGGLSIAIPGVMVRYALPDLAFVYRLWMWVLGGVVVAVTSVTSATIYGLQRRMQAARRLGQYQLDHRVGQGGMGEVYLATHSLLQRPTAIKLLRDVTSAAARDRFRQEVQTASGLTHPNTVEIYDYGRTPDGVFYFAMEYVEGASLEEAVRATGAMPSARVVRVLEQAAGSLGEAHRRGLVHRDIKPSNLMLCERGGDFDTLKVLDFGLVRNLADAELESGGLTGTPLYLAPEAILDPNGFVPESDVYALGATAYFLLTGRPPFAEGDLIDVLSDHLAREVVPPETDDPVLAELVVRCLAKDPAARPSDASDLLHALENCEGFGRWRLDDARAWWAEHREVVQAVRGEASADSSRRSKSPRTS